MTQAGANGGIDSFIQTYSIPASSIQILDKDGNVIKTLNEEDLKSLSQEVLGLMINDVRKYKDFGMNNTVLKQLIELKKAWFPATQVSKNLNVNLFDTQLNKWYEAAKELRKQRKEEIEVVEIIPTK